MARTHDGRPTEATTTTVQKQTMIALDDPAASPALGSFWGPGGFVWWYLEIGDGAGNAVVCIWSFGLPFLPGIAGAARDGAGPAAATRPSMHVAGYLAGREEMYVLHELPPEQVEALADGWRFGGTTIHSRLVGDALELHLQLDLPVHNGPRLVGEVRVLGQRARWQEGHREALDASAHRWTPLCGAAFGTARLRCGDTRLLVTGRAYHDRNHAPRSLEALGIGLWVWGRVAHADHDRVFYALEPADGGDSTTLAVTVDGDGTLRLEPDAAATCGDRRRTRWGMREARHWAVTTRGGAFLAVDTTAAIEDGPFYLRRLVRSATGEHGTLEAITPARIDRPWQRPLIRMRVSDARRRGSIWLPLFEGPRRHRVARLLGLWRDDGDATTDGDRHSDAGAIHEGP